MSLTKSDSPTGVGTEREYPDDYRRVEHGYELPDWWIEQTEKRHTAERKAEQERLEVVNAS